MITKDVKQPLQGIDSDYRYRHFTTNLLFRDLRFRKGAAEPGDSLAPFQIVTTNGDNLENPDVFSDKPVLLIMICCSRPKTNLVIDV